MSKKLQLSRWLPTAAGASLLSVRSRASVVAKVPSTSRMARPSRSALLSRVVFSCEYSALMVISKVMLLKSVVSHSP